MTGNDAAAKRDVLATSRRDFRPPGSSSRRRRPGAARRGRDRRGPRELSAELAVDVVVVARGGGSFEDLLPFSDERLVRAIAACPVPVVSAVGHEQDTPLCDLAADARASTPTAAAVSSCPTRRDLRERLGRAAPGSKRGARTLLERDRASGSSTRTSGSAVLRRSRRAQAARGSSTPPGGCARSRRAQRSTAASDRAGARSDRPLGRAVDARRPRRRRGRRRPLRRARRERADQPPFEEAQRELEQIVERLERGRRTSTRRSALGARRGAYRLCVGKLDAAQGTIEELAHRVDAARPYREPHAERTRSSRPGSGLRKSHCLGLPRTARRYGPRTPRSGPGTAAGHLARGLPAARGRVHCSLARDDEVVARGSNPTSRGRSAAPGHSSAPREASAAPRPPAAPAPGRSRTAAARPVLRAGASSSAACSGVAPFCAAEHAGRIERGHVDVTNDARRRRELPERRTRSPSPPSTFAVPPRRRRADTGRPTAAISSRARGSTPSSGRAAPGSSGIASAASTAVTSS